jgi:hypothetical protein
VENLQVLPLAITMMAGPQILSAILFITSDRPIRVSSLFVIGVALGTTLGVTIATLLGGAVGDKISIGSTEDSGSAHSIIEYALVALLALYAFRTYRHRATAEPPKLLGKMVGATPRLAFQAGFLLVTLFPSDVIVLLTVGLHLGTLDQSVIEALPFIGLTTLIAGLPLLGYLLFRHRAKEAMPKVRDWMNDHSWVITIVCCAVFIFLIAS